jgi:subtilisin family serine protease
MRLWGTVQTATEPYLSLSGTSMASPVVTGTIALMLQANPSLTPNEIKAVLQFTAESRAGYDGLTEGAGFLNTRGAVELARSLAAGGGFDVAASHDDPTRWSAHVLWGNHMLRGAALAAVAPLWATGALWGTPSTALEAGGDVQGAAAGDDDNVVWGEACGGADCHGVAWIGAMAGSETDPTIRGAAADTADDVLWSAPAIRRPSRVIAMDAPLR